MKILIAADGSAHTKRMLAYLAAHEWLATAHQYTVLTVVSEVPKRAASFVDSSAVKSYYEDEARAVLDPVRAFFAQQGIEAQFVHKVGHPAQEIANYAKQGKFDMLMLGSHGHGVLGNLIMGSVATKVLSLSEVPVLLLR